MSAWVGRPASKPAKIRVPAATTIIGNQSLSFLTSGFWGKGAAEPISCRIRAISLIWNLEQPSEYQGRSKNAEKRARLHAVQLFSGVAPIVSASSSEPILEGKDNLLPFQPRPRVSSARSKGQRCQRRCLKQCSHGGHGPYDDVVRTGEKYLGVIGLMDTPRAAAAATLKRLRTLGITRMIMISGDNQRVADAIAKEVGLDDAWGDLVPEDKIEPIKKLKAEDKIAMVGDGVNDAPAMANAP